MASHPTVESSTTMVSPTQPNLTIDVVQEVDMKPVPVRRYTIKARVRSVRRGLLR